MLANLAFALLVTAAFIAACYSYIFVGIYLAFAASKVPSDFEVAVWAAAWPVVVVVRLIAKVVRQ